MRRLSVLVAAIALALGAIGCEKSILDIWRALDPGSGQPQRNPAVNVTIFPDSVYTTAEVEAMNPTYYTAGVRFVENVWTLDLATVETVIDGYTYTWWVAKPVGVDSTWYLMPNLIGVSTTDREGGWTDAQVDSLVAACGGSVVTCRWGARHALLKLRIAADAGRFATGDLPLVEFLTAYSASPHVFIVRPIPDWVVEMLLSSAVQDYLPPQRPNIPIYVFRDSVWQLDTAGVADDPDLSALLPLGGFGLPGPDWSTIPIYVFRDSVWQVDTLRTAAR